MQIENSVVIVTGASAGIGKATVKILAQKGANVAMVARRAERLEALAAELAHFPGERIVIAGDLSDEAFCEGLVSKAVDGLGRVDVLINNAGLGHRSHLANTASSDMRTMFNVNVLGLMLASQSAIKQMRLQKGGRGQIINISSVVSTRPLPGGVFYAATKSMVNFLSRGLRMELGKEPILVTTVYPGYTITEFPDARLGKRGVRHDKLKGVSAETVGETIVRAIEKEQKEVYVGRVDWAFTHLGRLFPRTLDKLFARIMPFKS